MSELFNALQKLEEKNAPDSTPAPPPVSGNGEGNRKRVPYLRALLLLLVVLLVTGLSLAFLWFEPDLPFLSKGIQQMNAAPEEVLPESAESLPEAVPPKNEMSIKEVVIGVIQIREDAPAAIEDVLHKAEGNQPSVVQHAKENIVSTAYDVTEKVDAQQQNIETLNREFGREKHEPQAVDKFHDIKRERNMVQRKRLVYRAEKLRVQGDAAAALKLYKQAWSISPTPALANNMAAILIGTEQYTKAESYLQKGLQLAPTDNDLLYNLEIAKQGKKQK